MISFSNLYQKILEADERKPIVNQQPDVNDPEYRAAKGNPYQLGVNKSRQMRDVGSHLDRRWDKGYARNTERPDAHPGVTDSTGEEIEKMNNIVASTIYKYVRSHLNIFKPGTKIPVSTVVRLINHELPTTTPQQIMQAVALVSNLTKQKLHSPLFRYSNQEGNHMVEVIPYGNFRDQEAAHPGRYLHQKLKANQSEARPEDMTPDDMRAQAMIAKLVKEYKAQKGINNKENAIKVAQQLLGIANQIENNPNANSILVQTAKTLKEKLQGVV